MTLTIHIDEEKLSAAEEWARAHGETVEQLVEKYLENLATKSDQTANASYQGETKSFTHHPVSDEIRKLQDEAGIGETGDFDERKEFEEHIKRKHA